MIKTIEDIIREKGFFFTQPKGTSMFPMLRGGEVDICVLKIEEPLKKYDVALYRRTDGTLVLHRVWSVEEDSYTFCGDNQWTLESGISREQILGRLDSWHQRGKKHTVRDKGYLRYVRFWCKSLSRRRFILWFWHKLYRAKTAAREVSEKLFGKKG